MDEGYIKYKAIWTKETIDVAQTLIDEISFWRNKLLEKSWIGLYPNGIGFGNLSKRLSQHSFLISATATGGVKQAEHRHYAIVNGFDLNKNTIECKGELPASSESLSHAALYNENVNCIIHIHCEDLWVKYIDKLHTTTATLAYGTVEMAIELQRIQALIENDFGVIIMGGHPEGIIAYGSDFDQVFNILLDLEQGRRTL